MRRATALCAAVGIAVSALAVVSPYDEKVMEESTFYGLPQWSLGAPSSGPVVLPSTSGSASPPI